MSENITNVLERIFEKNPRFSPDAYVFISDALAETVRKLGREKLPIGQRHVSGRELAEGMADVALDRFGPMTYQVLKNWGLTKTRDIGDIVYTLIDEKVFSASESDKVEDFDDVYDFRQRFLAPWES